jgi:hypothetical protein
MKMKNNTEYKQFIYNVVKIIFHTVKITIFYLFRKTDKTAKKIKGKNKLF